MVSVSEINVKEKNLLVIVSVLGSGRAMKYLMLNTSLKKKKKRVAIPGMYLAFVLSSVLYWNSISKKRQQFEDNYFPGDAVSS